MSFLEVSNLQVSFPTEDGIVHAVDGVSFSVERGKVLAVVGESGSGKSVTSQAVMGLLNRKATKISGSVVLDGQDLLAMDDKDVRKLRGGKMAMIFQDPLSSLHPYYRISKQLVEAVRVHQNVSTSDARKQAIAMLDQVGIPAPERRIDDYPHQLSGGMRQRVMIAMALLNNPALLIADEPTTALDVTVQAQIIELIQHIQQVSDAAIIFITHDLGVVAEIAHDVLVMYAGRIVEYAPVETLYGQPQMPYTLGLMASIPRLDRDPDVRLDPIPGNPPSLINLPSGCSFNPRCTFSDQVLDGRCSVDLPDLLPAGEGHLVRCHLPIDTRKAISVQTLAALNGGVL
ncbi:MAG: ABC transporter ATP-binding protein [Actinobacteria bacterium]|nr:ABC transporter ATP-binding protein [Actinomycetota bacterium]